MPTKKVAPDPVTNLKEDKDKTTETTIYFTWDVPVSNGGEAIIGYDIQQVNGTTYPRIIDTFFTWGGFHAQTPYSFSVTAKNSVGESSPKSLEVTTP